MRTVQDGSQLVPPSFLSPSMSVSTQPALHTAVLRQNNVCGLILAHMCSKTHCLQAFLLEVTATQREIIEREDAALHAIFGLIDE